MPGPYTSIKVPVSLRDRLARHARADSVSLSEVIDRVLTWAEEQEFWNRIDAQHVSLGDADKASYLPDAALADNLIDQDDDRISAEGRW